MSTRYATVAYDAIKRTTKYAICFEIEGKDYWFPKSQIIQHDKEAKEIEIAEWIAEKEGLI